MNLGSHPLADQKVDSGLKILSSRTLYLSQKDNVHSSTLFTALQERKHEPPTYAPGVPIPGDNETIVQVCKHFLVGSESDG